MEKSGGDNDNFWKWGNSRKKMVFTAKADGPSFKIHCKNGSTYSQLNASKFGGGLGVAVERSDVELNAYKKKKLVQDDEVFVKGKSCVALDILADVASRALQQEEKEKEKEKEKASVGQWKIYGVSDSLKIVIKRVKKSDSTPSISDRDFLPASKVGNTITSTVTVSSPTKRCIEDIEIKNVCSSKRNGAA